MKAKRFLALLFLCLTWNCFSVLGQKEQVVDSLKSILDSSREISEKIKIHLLLSRQFRGSIPIVAIDYGDKALKLAQELNDTNQIADSYYILGQAHYMNGNHTIALQYYLDVIELSNKIKQRVNDLSKKLQLSNEDKGELFLLMSMSYSEGRGNGERNQSIISCKTGSWSYRN